MRHGKALKWCWVMILGCVGSATVANVHAEDGGVHPTVDIAFDSGAPYYLPKLAVVGAHTAVRWWNPTASPHSVRHDGCVTDGPCAFDSLAVMPDESVVIAPLPPGTYPYHCELHPIMRGVVVVVEGHADGEGRPPIVGPHARR